ncbi:MAG: hypothetical protein J0H15_12625 [Xanthomonadales bacterium]|nr:hypothetical protein [Xanthomonadales bacterium]
MDGLAPRIAGALSASRRIAGWAVAVGILALSASDLLAWESYPMPAEPGFSGIVIGDFDGDGRREAVIGGIIPVLGRTGGPTVLATIGGEQSEARVRSVSMPPGLDLHADSMLLFKGNGGPDRILAIANIAGEGVRIVLLGGIPLKVEKLLALPAPYQPYRLHAVADVDADGHPEIVASVWAPGVGSRPAIIDASSGALLWMGDMAAEHVGVAQLDADPALELIISGTPGQIVDGATKAIEWSWAGGFPGWVLAGRFDAGPRQSFAASVGNALQVFRGEPYGPVFEFPLASGMSYMRVVEADVGGAVEIASQDYRGVRFFDPLSGVLTREVAAGADGMFEIGAIGGDAEPLLVNRARNPCPFHDGAIAKHVAYGKYLQLTRLDDGTCRRWLGNHGSHAAVARGALDGLGSDLVVSYSQADVLSVYDARAGTRLRFRNEVFSFGGGSDRVHMVLAARSGGASSIVLANDPGVPVAVDPVSLEIRWRAWDPDRTVSDMSAIDVDGDGADEIVFATKDAKVVILDGESGATIRESAAGEAWSWPRLLAFHDAQGQPRALVSAGQNEQQVDLFDLATASPIRRIDAATAPVIGLRQWGQGPACRIAMLDAVGGISVRDCEALLELHRRQAPAGTVFVREADPEGNAFIVAADEHLYALDADGTSRQISTALGPDLGAGNAGDVRQLAGKDRWQVTIGSDVLVSLQYVAPDPLFASGFE